MHPVGDNLKIKVAERDKFDLGNSNSAGDSGVVVEIPDVIHYFGYHSFAFEKSFMAEELQEIKKYFYSFLGKRVWWESFQDKGRRFKEADGEYVYLKMSDVLIYSDDIEIDAEAIDDTRSGGFKI